jgi:succinate dehydrogenase/fumarate reductase cytochrome b subunit
MSILVIGRTGIVGSHMVRGLRHLSATETKEALSVSGVQMTENQTTFVGVCT